MGVLAFWQEYFNSLFKNSLATADFSCQSDTNVEIFARVVPWLKLSICDPGYVLVYFQEPNFWNR